MAAHTYMVLTGQILVKLVKYGPNQPDWNVRPQIIAYSLSAKRQGMCVKPNGKIKLKRKNASFCIYFWCHTTSDVGVVATWQFWIFSWNVLGTHGHAHTKLLLLFICCLHMESKQIPVRKSNNQENYMWAPRPTSRRQPKHNQKMKEKNF